MYQRENVPNAVTIFGVSAAETSPTTKTPTTYNFLAAGNNTTNNIIGMEIDCMPPDIPPRTLWVVVQLLYSPLLASGNMWQHREIS
jgi:hypothetical protein